MKDFIRNRVFAIPLISVLAIGISGSAIVWKATSPEQVAVQAPPAEASTVSWSQTPAAEAIRKTMASVPKEWTRRGEQLVSVTPPFPLSCNIGGVQSSYSVSQQYNNGTTVALASYTAGTGALAFNHVRSNSGQCVADNTYVTNVEESGIGAEAFTINVRRGSATSQTTVFRRGDVIGFVLVDGGVSHAGARTVDKVLASTMGEQCLNQTAGADEAKRTIWSGQPFTGLLIDYKASIGKWSAPSVPPKSSYKATTIPANLTQVEAVTMPEVPDYPVWPLLPAEKKMPELPKAPAAAAVVEKTVKTRIPDVKGPGCGWAFTGTVAPAFNDAEVKASNDTIINEAKAELTKNAEAWSKSVLSYWEAVAGYQKSVKDYEKFRTEVIKTSAAWEPIHQDWREYFTQLANHEAEVRVRDEFIARKAAAKKSYEAAVEVCNAPEPTPTPTPSPSEKATESPTPKPSPSSTTQAPRPAPTPTPAPTATAEAIEIDRMSLTVPMVREGCPAPRPAILDEEEPNVSAAPEKPENPIPADKR
jgi:hypothetical protein